jgi:acetyltransferase-like isoleucine patch superfamily enzyme/glycine cleavage system H lipoate-binding protein
MSSNLEETVWVYSLKNSPSDEHLIINEIAHKNGDQVLENQTLLEVEGAKAIFEIEAPSDGYVYFFVTQNDKVLIGESIAIISTIKLNTMPERKFLKTETENNEVHNEKLTAKAKTFLNLAKIDPTTAYDAFQNTVIREKNLKRFVTSSNTQDRKKLSELGKILIIGGGTGAEIAYDLLTIDQKAQIVGVADPSFNILEARGIPTKSDFEITKINDMISSGEVNSLLIAHNEMETRKKFLEFAKEKSIELVNVISSKSAISSSADYGMGLFIGDFSRLAADSYLGDNVFLSSYVNIDHHCAVGDNTTFGPGVFLSGRVVIGQNCVFGSMISIEPKIVIGNNCIIASGSVITQDIPSNSLIKNEGQIKIRRKT